MMILRNTRLLLCIFALFRFMTGFADAQELVMGTYNLDIDQTQSLSFSTSGPLISAYWSVVGDDAVVIENEEDLYGGARCRVRAVKNGRCKVYCDFSNYSTNMMTSYDHCYVWNFIVWDGMPDSVILPEEVEVIKGETTTVHATMLPGGARCSVYWSVSDPQIAEVTETELSGQTATIAGLSMGTTTLMARTTNWKTATSRLKVYGNSPTSVSISGLQTVELYGGAQLSANFVPDTHRSVVTWSSSDAGIAAVDTKGYVQAWSFGTATITARTANGLTAKHDITVVPPLLKVHSANPESLAQQVEVTVSPEIDFYRDIKKGADFEKISLVRRTSTGNIPVNGTKQIVKSSVFNAMSTLRFTPDEELQELSTYILTIPKNALLNEWDEGLQDDYTLQFTTGSLKTMILSMKKEGNKVTLNCDNPKAEILYTVNGTEPTQSNGIKAKSGVPITFNSNCTLWAKAFCPGYRTFEVKQYVDVSGPNMVAYYPSEPYYQLHYPYIEFDKDIFPGPNWESAMVRESILDYDLSDIYKWNYVWGDFVIFGRYLVFLKRGLDSDHHFMFNIPAGVVKSAKGTVNDAFMVKMADHTASKAELKEIKIINPVVSLSSREESYTLAYPVPSNADRYFTWTSSDESIVNPDWQMQYFGNFTGGNKGKTVLTATADNGVTATCKVYVDTEPDPEPEALPVDVIGLFPYGKAPYIMKDINPYVEYNHDIMEGENIDECVVINYDTYDEVSGEYIITGNRLVFVPEQPLEQGVNYAVFIPTSAVITADGRYNEYKGGYPWSRSTDESLPLEGIEMKDNVLQLTVGSRAVVLAQPVPLQADYSQWQWSSSNTSIVRVTTRGVVTALAEGETVVTLTTDNGLSGTCRIIVAMANNITNSGNSRQCFDVYSLSGKLLKRSVTTLHGLPRGVVIIRMNDGTTRKVRVR